MKNIKLEIAKCDILCVNCSRLKYARKERKRKDISTQRQLITAEKLSRAICLHCDLHVTADTVMMFDFDHIDPMNKIMGISDMVQQLRSVEEIAAEMKKCQLLCARCHVIRTFTQRGIRK
jgi:hypothetical protein